MAARVILVAVCLVAAACSDSGGDAAPPTTGPPETTTTEPAPTTILTTTTAGVPRTTTAIPLDIQGGNARFQGTVTGPQGQVPDATVRIERLVEDEVVTLDVNAPGGAFSLAGIRGGRYRLRAWKAPDLVQLQPEVLFLAADEDKRVELKLTQVGDLNVLTTIDPERLPVDDPFVVAAFVYAGTVNGEGALQAVGRPGVQAQIAAGAGLGVVGPSQTVTDAGGRAVFQLRCLQGGQVSADIVVPTARVPVALPACPGGQTVTPPTTGASVTPSTRP